MIGPSRPEKSGVSKVTRTFGHPVFVKHCSHLANESMFLSLAETSSFCRNKLFLQKEVLSAHRSTFCRNRNRISVILKCWFLFLCFCKISVSVVHWSGENICVSLPFQFFSLSCRRNKEPCLRTSYNHATNHFGGAAAAAGRAHMNPLCSN